MKLLFPKLFAHVPVEGLEAWAGLIREEVAKEGLCPPVGPVVVGAENEAVIRQALVVLTERAFCRTFMLGERFPKRISYGQASYDQGCG
jgi:hypothetical protein